MLYWLVVDVAWPTLSHVGWSVGSSLWTWMRGDPQAARIRELEDRLKRVELEMQQRRIHEEPVVWCDDDDVMVSPEYRALSSTLPSSL